MNNSIKNSYHKINMWDHFNLIKKIMSSGPHSTGTGPSAIN